MKLAPESSQFNLIQTYVTEWIYPLNAQVGDYTMKVAVIDNNGANNIADKGTPDLTSNS
jgi:hypothetical protein